MASNAGYSGANNAGVSVARGNRIVLLNSDVIPGPPRAGWARCRRSTTRRRASARSGPKLLYEDDSLQHAGHVLLPPNGGRLWANHHYFKGMHRTFAAANVARAVPAMTAACMMIDRDLYQEAGGLSHAYVQGGYEDSDLCLRLIEMGRENWYMPGAELYHLEAQSFTAERRKPAAAYNVWLHTKTWDERIAAVTTEHGRRPARHGRGRRRSLAMSGQRGGEKVTVPLCEIDTVEPARPDGEHVAAAALESPSAGDRLRDLDPARGRMGRGRQRPRASGAGHAGRRAVDDAGARPPRRRRRPQSGARVGAPRGLFRRRQHAAAAAPVRARRHRRARGRRPRPARLDRRRARAPAHRLRAGAAAADRDHSGAHGLDLADPPAGDPPRGDRVPALLLRAARGHLLDRHPGQPGRAGVVHAAGGGRGALPGPVVARHRHAHDFRAPSRRRAGALARLRARRRAGARSRSSGSMPCTCASPRSARTSPSSSRRSACPSATCRSCCTSCIRTGARSSWCATSETCCARFAPSTRSAAPPPSASTAPAREEAYVFGVLPRRSRTSCASGARGVTRASRSLRGPDPAIPPPRCVACSSTSASNLPAAASTTCSRVRGSRSPGMAVHRTAAEPQASIGRWRAGARPTVCRPSATRAFGAGARRVRIRGGMSLSEITRGRAPRPRRERPVGLSPRRAGGRRGARCLRLRRARLGPGTPEPRHLGRVEGRAPPAVARADGDRARRAGRPVPAGRGRPTRRASSRSSTHSTWAGSSRSSLRARLDDKSRVGLATLRGRREPLHTSLEPGHRPADGHHAGPHRLDDPDEGARGASRRRGLLARSSTSRASRPTGWA